VSAIEAPAIRTPRHTFIGGAPDTPQALRSRYERITAGSPDPSVFWLNRVIRFRDEARLAGTVQAAIISGGHDPVAEIAWVVGSEGQGRGIAAEAARGLVDWLGRLPVRGCRRAHPPRASGIRCRRHRRRATPTDEWHDGEIQWHRSTGPRLR
jgi:hypothetical protein